MELIDERGRLFGVVNIIDALVVLLVLAVVVAGAALVLGEGKRESGSDVTRTVTVTSEPLSESVASLISSGDTLSPGENATVMDVYLTPTRSEGVRATLQLRVTGKMKDGAFTVAGKTIRTGRSITLTSPEYKLNGSVTAVGTNESLPVGNTSVAIETRLPAVTASALQASERLRIAGHHVATVTSVASYPTNDSAVRRVVLGLRLRTLSTAGKTTYAGRAVRVGSTLPIRTDRYDISGQVINYGSTSPPGESKTVTARVVWESVRPTVAEDVRVGATERSHGTTYAKVTERTVQPATVIVTSDDGQVHARDHPRLKNVTLTVELDARRTSSGLFFHGRSLRIGNTVIFEFGNTTIEGTVVELE